LLLWTVLGWSAHLSPLTEFIDIIVVARSQARSPSEVLLSNFCNLIFFDVAVSLCRAEQCCSHCAARFAADDADLMLELQRIATLHRGLVESEEPLHSSHISLACWIKIKMASQITPAMTASSHRMLYRLCC
jgi:hypothetical protein